MHLQAGLVRMGMPYVVLVWVEGEQEQGEGLRRGKGQQAPTRELDDHLRQAVLCPSVDIRTHACTVSAPERPQIAAATGPDTAQLTGPIYCVYSMYLCFCISACLYVAYRSPALQSFSIETTETRMPLHTHGRHPVPRIYPYIPCHPP